MAPRGTRRPHAKRVRSKPVNLFRTGGPRHTGGGGGPTKSGCGLILLALISLPAVLAVVTR